MSTREARFMRRYAEATSARNILAGCRIPLGEDFHALRYAQVCALLEYADAQRYRKPRNANGSRARYFHALMQRRARLQP